MMICLSRTSRNQFFVFTPCNSCSDFRRKGKGNGKLISEEATITSASGWKIETQLPQDDDSDDETLSTILR